MTLMHRLRLICTRFHRDSEGSMPTEGVIAFAFLAWWYVASYQFFDAFRQKNVNLKAAYTISDLLSRETGYDASIAGSVPIDQDYIDGLNKVFDYLTYSNRPTWIRVTSVKYYDVAKKYMVHWSATSSNVTFPAHNNTSINKEAWRLPVMPAGDTVILVETSMAYDPIFTFVLPSSWVSKFIVTRPRFASCVPWGTTGGC